MTQKITRRLFASALALAPLPALVPLPALAQPAQAGRRAAAPVLSAQDKVLVDRAVAYLQGLTRAKGRFTQIDARGKTATGDLFLQRPGKARLAYDAPNNLLVISDGSQVAVHDKRLNNFELYPLNLSPLSLFLAKEIRLDRGVLVSEVRRGAGVFSLTARDKNQQTAGQITLVFNESPMVLREWTLVDAQGSRTRVVLNSLTPVSSLDKALFVIRDPRPRPATGRKG